MRKTAEITSERTEAGVSVCPKQHGKKGKNLLNVVTHKTARVL